MFECWFRLPLYPFGQKFLSRVGLTPAQLAPNAWGVLFSLGILLWLKCRETEDTMLLNVEQVLAYFEVTRIPK